MFDNKKVIIFDVDGTLLDTIGIWSQVDIKLISAIGGEMHDKIDLEREAFLAKSVGANTYMEYAKYIKNRYNSSFSDEKIFQLRNQIAMNLLMHEVDFKNDAEVFIRMAKKNGFVLVIASATTKWAMNLYTTKNTNIMKKCNIPEIFDLIILKDDVEKMKPHPEIYLKVLSALNVEAKDCIVLEDSLSGVKAAKNAGIEVINIYDKYSDRDREEIMRLADYFVLDFAELSNVLASYNK